MDRVLNEALDRYFNALSKIGYINYKEVDKLLILIFVYDMFYSRYRYFLTEDDYRVVNNALYCLYGSSCIVPFNDVTCNLSREIGFEGSFGCEQELIATLDLLLDLYDSSLSNQLEDIIGG